MTRHMAAYRGLFDASRAGVREAAGIDGPGRLPRPHSSRRPARSAGPDPDGRSASVGIRQGPDVLDYLVDDVAEFRQGRRCPLSWMGSDADDGARGADLKATVVDMLKRRFPHPDCRASARVGERSCTPTEGGKQPKHRRSGLRGRL